MAMPFPIPVTAAEVGTYFVGQYYQVLQQQPEFVHQFYSDASTMLRIDGNRRETATAMLQIHALVMSLNYTGVEIKTAHSLESWNGGILVMVSGSVQLISGRRKFVQTFFLAPQEKGYFVLNDIFHFMDEDLIHHQPSFVLAQSNSDFKLNAATAIPEPGQFLLGGEIHKRELVAPDVKENATVNNYGFTEQWLQEISDSQNTLECNTVDQSNGSLLQAANVVEDHLSVSVEEAVGEPQKHTYASILRFTKGAAPSQATQISVSKNVSPTSDWNHPSQTTNQQAIASSKTTKQPIAETADEVVPLEDEDEIKSVYVRNLPPAVSSAEIEEEFKKFGTLKQPEGVVIRSRKDVGVCYAFVEFEDIMGVHNAVKVSSVQIAGQQVYIEERRSNSNIPSRVARRGRGRGRRSSYQAEAPRGQFNSRYFGQGSGYDGGDQEYNRPRGNGFYRPSPRQDRGNPGRQASRGRTSPDLRG